MTLKEWKAKYQSASHTIVTKATDGYVYHPSLTAQARWELYHLDDYAVSSHGSGGYFLFRRRNVDRLVCT